MMIKIHDRDNVLLDTETGHKYAACAVKKGEYIIKYGYPIGKATADIKPGEHVHTHNLASYITESEEYVYQKERDELTCFTSDRKFPAFVRKNGDVGIRNDTFIIPTVGCVNSIASELARLTGARALTHPYGCSQSGDDLLNTQKTLANIARHPNAGGVLILGLGCENNNMASFLPFLKDYDRERVRTLVCQDCDDEIEAGVKIIRELQSIADGDKRVPVPLSKLRVGLKCGGSDGLSGITANPLVGKFTDKLVSLGGTCVLTEVPEMFGAEQILMNRCVDRATFSKTVRMINGFKSYFVSHGRPITENPSPGNKEGGITTIEEKSLGCIQKAGRAPVLDVLDYGETVKKAGLSLLNGPGNDIVSLTNLFQASCHLILFTTGRGTPLGSFVPTVKISSNRRLSEKKMNWIDFDASPALDGNDLTDALFERVISVASGEKTKNEQSGNAEIAIFKSGVTL